MIGLLALTGCTLPTGQDRTIAISGAPEVRIAAPLPNASYLAGVTVNIQAAVTNAGDDIDRVEFAVDNEIISTRQSPNAVGAPAFNVTQTWPAEEVGSHLISVTAFRTDGTSSNPATVTINVIDPDDATVSTTGDTARGGGQSDGMTDGETDTADEPAEPAEPEAVEQEQAAPTDPPEPSATPEPSEIPASATPDVPTARFTTGINVRSGPDVVFDPPIGAFRANDTSEILAVNPAGTWYKVRYYNGEGWVFGDLADVSGNVNNLPVDAGPPLPTPVPPTSTPVPVTVTPSVTNNLVPISPFLAPPQPQCGQDFTAGVTIRNDGSQEISTGLTRIRVIRVADGQEIRSSGDALVAVNLPPGGTHTVQFTFNIDVFVNEEHRVEFIADANNQVSETIEDDNTTGITYPMPPC
jgi:hypothetical protein